MPCGRRISEEHICLIQYLWMNAVSPFTRDEDITIQQAYESLGNRWTQIAELLPVSSARNLTWRVFDVLFIDCLLGTHRRRCETTLENAQSESKDKCKAWPSAFDARHEHQQGQPYDGSAHPSPDDGNCAATSARLRAFLQSLRKWCGLRPRGSERCDSPSGSPGVTHAKPSVDGPPARSTATFVRCA